MASTAYEHYLQNHSTYFEWRQRLHQFPEKHFDVTNTLNWLESVLSKMPLDGLWIAPQQAGIVAVVGSSEGPSLGLRADFDALPIHEQNDFLYRSKIDGHMHACGHDGHTAMLLASLDYLAHNKPKNGKIVAIFQAAEEIGQGAKAMIKAGLLERFPLDMIFGLHNWPGIACGQIVFSEGPVMSTVNEFEIEVNGEGGHAAMPQLCDDVLSVAVSIYQAIQQSKSTWHAFDEPLILTPTSIHSGDAFNVIADKAIIRGTVRYLDDKFHTIIPQKIKHVTQDYAAAHNINAKFTYKTHSHATINHPHAVKEAHQAVLALKQEIKPQPQTMASEDFCYYLHQIPGAYGFIGNGIESQALHSPKYDFNDKAIEKGMAFYAALAASFLRG